MSDNRRGTYINRLSSRISSRLSTKVGSFGFHHAAKEPLKTRTAQFHGDVSHDVQCFAVKLNLMAFDYEEFLVTEGKVRREEKSTLLDEVRLMLLQAKKTLSIYEGTYVEAQDLLKRNAINLHKIMHPSNNHQETTGLPGRINSNDPQLYPAAFNPDQKGPSKPSQQYHRQSTESKRFSSFSSEASILPFDDVFLTQQTDTGPSLPPRPKLKLKAGFDDKIAYRRVGSTASNFTFSVDVRTEHGNTTDQSTEIDKSRLHKFHSGLGAASIKSKKSTKTNRKKSTMPKGKKFLPLRRNMTTVNPRGSMKIRTTKSRKLKIAGRGKKVKRTNSLFNPPNATTKGRNNSPSELTLVQTETQSQTGSVNLRHNADESACSEERRKFEQVHLIPLETCLRKLRSLIKELELQVKDLELKSRDLEMRTKQNGSVCGVYNEVTGQVEWKEFDHGGVCGVWNPHLMEIEWLSKKGYGVHGVYNPKTKQVEWRAFRNGGVYGVWNPSSRTIEWKESFREGVCGVWNPETEVVEFKTFRNGGIVGYFDAASRQPVWKKKEHKGVCLVKRDRKDNVYLTICSSISNWFEK